MKQPNPLREELETIIVQIQLRRDDAKTAVDKLLAQKAAQGQDGEKNPPVIRFQNDGAEHEEWVVADSFEVCGKQFEPGHHCAARNGDDGKIELENRATGDRVQMTSATYDKVKKHLRPEWDGGEYDF